MEANSLNRDLLIRTVYGEAANEPAAGQAAVANVILNRVKAGRYGGQDLPSVVFAPKQFEPWDARPDALLSLSQEDPKYQQIGKIVDGVFNGLPDPTDGATHFLNPEIVRQRRGGSLPNWAGGQGQAIGRHTFYAPEGKVTRMAQNVASIPQKTNGLSWGDRLIAKRQPNEISDQQIPQPANKSATWGERLKASKAQTPEPQQAQPVEFSPEEMENAPEIGQAIAGHTRDYSRLQNQDRESFNAENKQLLELQSSIGLSRNDKDVQKQILESFPDAQFMTGPDDVTYARFGGQTVALNKSGISAIDAKRFARDAAIIGAPSAMTAGVGGLSCRRHWKACRRGNRCWSRLNRRRCCRYWCRR